MPSACSARTPPDADDDFLADAHFATTDVQLSRNRAVGGIVFIGVGVEQQHRHAADLGQPHARVDVAVGKIDGSR